MVVWLYGQIKNDRENGINNLKTFMSNTIPRTATSDFSHIGLDYNTLMNICENIKTSGFDFSNYNFETEISQGNHSLMNKELNGRRR